MWRAVLHIPFENCRMWGNGHREARETASNLLDKFRQRISDAERIRVLELVQNDTPPSTLGLQPRHAGEFIGAGIASVEPEVQQRQPREMTPQELMSSVQAPSTPELLGGRSESISATARTHKGVDSDLHQTHDPNTETEISVGQRVILIDMKPRTDLEGRFAAVTGIDDVKNQVGVEIDDLNFGHCRYTYWVPRKHIHLCPTPSWTSWRAAGVVADSPGNQGVEVVVPEYYGAPQASNTERCSPMFWRRFGCKRKVQPTDFVKNPQPTKKVANRIRLEDGWFEAPEICERF